MLAVGTSIGDTINREEVFGPVMSVVRVADCVPILLHEGNTQVVAAVSQRHAGAAPGTAGGSRTAPLAL